MRSVVLHVFELSLDGIVGEEGTEFFQYCRELPDDDAHGEWIVSSLERASLHIMGRVTYQEMEQYWRHHETTGTVEDGIARSLNQTPKAVFSGTLQTADWPQTIIVSGDTVKEMDALRRQGRGEILAHGGASFAQSLARLDVVDEYRLNVFPYLAGSGKRLFDDFAAGRELELVSSKPFADGIVGLVYRRVR
jgi:dihydrofolate reductase